MTSWAGVVRDASSLALASRAVNSAAAELGSTLERATAEVRNLTDVARALLEAATEREETRGFTSTFGFPRCLARFSLQVVARYRRRRTAPRTIPSAGQL